MLLKADCQLFANLYVACQSTAWNLENVFAHEKHAFPVSLSKCGKLRYCGKSDFMHCLQNLQEPSLDPPNVQAIVADLAL